MIHNTSKIEAYLQKELDAQELGEFEQQLATDPEFAREVARQQDLQERLTGMRLRQKVDSALREQPVSPSKMPYLWAWTIVFLTCVVLAGTYYYFREEKQAIPPAGPIAEKAPLQTESQVISPETPEVASNTTQNGKVSSKTPDPKPPSVTPYIALAREFYVQPTGDIVRSTSQNNTTPTKIQEASAAFLKGNYQRACQLLEQDETLNGDDSARYLRGHARFKAGLYRAALSDFRLMEQSFQFKHEARWNVLLCQLALGQKIEKDLDQMIVDQDFPYHDAARRLRKKGG